MIALPNNSMTCCQADGTIINCLLDREKDQTRQQARRIGRATVPGPAPGGLGEVGPQRLSPLRCRRMSDVTRILSAIEQGDPLASEELLPLVYDELRRLAAQKMAQEAPGQTLQATALVHEAYLRLVDVPGAQHWDSRRHFFAAAAEAMRRILVESARRKQRLKHGGGRLREPEEREIPCPERPERVLALDEALDRLETTNPQAAEVVKLRYFAGFSNAEAAESLRISPRKADQVWAYARAWLREELGDDEEG
jgi:RNA polymerase sigma factor (TIGR02999 family)